jgi:hypothetical protein
MFIKAPPASAAGKRRRQAPPANAAGKRRRQTPPANAAGKRRRQTPPAQRRRHSGQETVMVGIGKGEA